MIFNMCINSKIYVEHISDKQQVPSRKRSFYTNPPEALFHDVHYGVEVGTQA